MNARLRKLRTALAEINDLESAAALLDWDQSTYMPPGGAQARGRQIATLKRLAHEKFTSGVIGKLLDRLLRYEEGLPHDSDEASLIRITRREYERATRIPASFMERFFSHMSTSYDVWTKARPANDFNAVRPALEKTLDLSRELADFFPGYEHIADPLIDFSDYGVKASTIRRLFSELRILLVPLVQEVTALPAPDDGFLHRVYPEPEQLAFGLDVIRRFGFDFERGRQDKTHHPFMTKFSLGDVRITTRTREDDLSEALFSTMHEAGHALYEQGICRDFEGSPLAEGASSGLHESQSRLWENLVGRNLVLWRYLYPKLQTAFPSQLGAVSLDSFYRAINKVRRSVIRTDADEVTYNLHVMLRFDLELELLEGSLSVAELPQAWNERYAGDIGVTPPDDRDGVLQDVHWYGGKIGGAFQGYTLGNVMAAQIMEAAQSAHPEITDEMGCGQFSTLLGWLRDRVHRHGAKFTANEVVEQATGSPLCIDPYVRYLRTKYGELYDL